jgi:hypothetical protein
MGEKVYVTNDPPSDPPPRAAEPLNYADPRLRKGFVEWLAGTERRLGGRNQIIFALGLGLLLSGIVAGISSRYGRRDGTFYAFLGGILVGLVVRVPLRRDE